MAGGTANPLPIDGVVGKLTPQQQSSLKDMWREFLQLIDSAPKEGSGGVSEVQVVDEKAPGNSIPKDDNAKERMKAEQETRDAKAAFAEYGSLRFLESYWRFIAMDDPDNIMLRFLRARKWSTSAGVAMLAACIKWRMGSDVEDIFRKGEEGMQGAEGFIKQMEIGKTYTQGTDHYGRPVIYIHVAKHRTFDQSAKALEDFVLFQMESVRCLFADAVDKVVMVFDMTGFGIRNIDWRCILFIVKCLEAYYPESLNVMLIHNAPWVFQGIWKLLGPMLDPVVRNKISMTKSTDDLVVHVPKKHLVKELGGENAWKWEYPPIVPGENAPQSDTEGRKKALAARDAIIAEYLEITRQWINSDDPLVEKKRQRVVNLMKAQYYELDPFIRGRGAYHRHGNIVGNGLVTFDYPTVAGERAEGEWECLGYSGCREQVLLNAEKLEKEIKELQGSASS
ncbi:CRAL-TRIO domain-containing protein [Leucosporidium creatinivorum]|uniref:CRAL-TRIO domain-containing protein n=1 Tax=Leucosporidium creatinivorum TaxID=106004 RepID=A0A1Y2G1A3_9BASI|nr:CRAL-TRIO domain-containing protein [Leucosporidium creatinivorum]